MILWNLICQALRDFYDETRLAPRDAPGWKLCGLTSQQELARFGPAGVAACLTFARVLHGE